VLSACCSSTSKKSEICFPLNLGVPGMPGVGIGTPSVALRLLSEEDEAKESEDASGSTGLIMKDGREKI